MRHVSKACIVILIASILAACANGAATLPANGSAAPGGNVRLSHATSNYKVLYRFQGTPDGASPLSGLITDEGALWGTTLNGSSNYCAQSCGSNECYLGCGTIYSIARSGFEEVRYNFKGNFGNAGDGSWPFAGLKQIHNGDFIYGTTGGGGAHGDGTIFRATTSGYEANVYSFSGGTDGQDPEASLIDAKGTLYGTTVYGGGSGCGGSGCGTVFAIPADSTKENVLYRFQGGDDGEHVYAPLTKYKGDFYGATLQGGGTGCGGNGCGSIFKVTKSGKETVIYRFLDGSDGAFPNGLTVVHNVLYGTTEGGGARSSGTFFSLTPSGHFTSLYSFKDIPDGNLPGAALVYYNGLFYGTTVGGGASGNGTVFSITKSGSETVLYSFAAGSDGAAPQAPVIPWRGSLYGTTYKGGGSGCNGNGCGTVFAIQP